MTSLQKAYCLEPNLSCIHTSFTAPKAKQPPKVAKKLKTRQNSAQAEIGAGNDGDGGGGGGGGRGVIKCAEQMRVVECMH